MGKLKSIAPWIAGLGIFMGALWGTSRYLHFHSILDWRIKPTYRSEHVASELRKMCQHDYGMSVEARRTGSNLQAFFWRVGLIRPGQTEMQPEAAEALERVLLCATRISLSTDAPLQFLQVKMVDALSGASVTLWRFVPDIRDSMYTRIAEEEYLNRLVVEFDSEADEKRQGWKEARWDPPMTMSQFLAKQVVLRVKRQSIGLQAHEDLSKPSTLTMIVDNWPTIKRQGAGQETKVTDIAEKTARDVVHSYHYAGFREFVLKDAHGLALKSTAF